MAPLSNTGFYMSKHEIKLVLKSRGGTLEMESTESRIVPGTDTEHV